MLYGIVITTNDYERRETMSNFLKAWHLYKLMNSQWWSYEKLKQLQEKKLKSIIKFSYENIPLYHEKFRAANIKPNDIRTIEDLQKIPYLTKDDIQQNYSKKIIAPNIDVDKCWTPHTGGSTGKPVTVVYDEHAEDFEKAVALRPNISCGQKLFDKWVVFTSPDNINLKTHHKKWFQRFGLFSQDCISLFEDVDKQMSMLEDLNPDVLDGYSSSLYLIAREIKKRGKSALRPRIIYGTSEMLTKEMRDLINSVFDVKMYDQFGSVEMGRTAWECPEHNGYHMDMEAVIMEFIADDEQVTSGERGEIVYTNLYNYAMPFIRFKIGDIGIPSDDTCPCGRTLPLMKIIEGRKDSFMKMPNGRIFPPTIWVVILMHYKLQSYKVIQEKIDKITIQIVLAENYTENIVKNIKRDTYDIIGKDVMVNVEVVDEIPREKSGKVKSIVSNVKIDW